VWLSTIAPTTSISWMLGILVLTIYLFAFEVVEVGRDIGIPERDEMRLTTGINSAAAPTFCMKDEINPKISQNLYQPLSTFIKFMI
jgi:hypothetical protein